MKSSTFIMLKPDAIDRQLDQTIIRIFEEEGFEIVRKKAVIVNEKLIVKHYEEVIEKVNQAYFKEAILKTFVDKTVIIMEIQKDSEDVIKEVRDLCGVTDPVKADPQSIRGRFKDDSLAVAMSEKRTLRNLIHASDSKENAIIEMNLWFNS